MRILAQALQHYAFAGIYFEQYSGNAAGFHAILGELYDRFRGFSRKVLLEAQDQILPKIAAEYGLDLNILKQFFEDTLGLALLLAI